MALLSAPPKFARYSLVTYFRVQTCLDWKNCVWWGGAGRKDRHITPSDVCLWAVSCQIIHCCGAHI